MNKFERQFIVDPSGNIEKKELTEEEKKILDERNKKDNLIRLKEDEKEFVADDKGNVEVKKEQ